MRVVLSKHTEQLGSSTGHETKTGLKSGVDMLLSCQGGSVNVALGCSTVMIQKTHIKRVKI